MKIDNLKGIHPGLIIRAELKRRHLNAAEFAISLKECPAILKSILKGDLQMTLGLALKIEQSLCLEEGCLMVMQVFYDIDREKRKLRQFSNNLYQITSERCINQIHSKSDVRLALLNIDQESKEYFVHKLEEVLVINELFLKKDLLIQELSVQVGLPKHHLSAIINAEFNLRYQDYISLKRIEYLIKNIKNSEWAGLSLAKMAERSGFNSRTTCFRAFVKHTGKSFSEYVKGSNERFISNY